ncbi:MAG: rubrerythrin [Alphaproteobacteria bacterium]|nr:rubrerythrin [Alphaproteobacteria bacterium]
MTEFINIKNVYTPERKLNEIEMLRAIKFAISSEFEAIQIYQQIAESTDNPQIHTVLAEIALDEKHHVGGLNKLLEILSPTDAQEYTYGAQETLDNISE